MSSAQEVVRRDIIFRPPDKLAPLFSRPKRVKLAVGGRGGGKSIAFADDKLFKCDMGRRICCAREFQNSIKDSVHSLMKSRIRALQGPDRRLHTLWHDAQNIYSLRGGEIFYVGLARNIDSIRSMFGVQDLWIEEGQSLSEASLEALFPTIRENDSEIYISMNRKSSKDPISKRLLKPHERDLKLNNGFYEDDYIIIVDINYMDNPFFPAVLEEERRRDLEVMSPALYNHIWLGHYSDTVDEAIITPDVFDACVDAHIKLGFQPLGIEVVAHDPADVGRDSKAIAHRHGNVILDVQYMDRGDVNDGADWAIGYAIAHRVDEFVWDGDGLGLGLRPQFDRATLGKKIGTHMFRGGMGVDYPDRQYEPADSALGGGAKTNKEAFINRRAQYYWMLRDMMVRTARAVTKGQYTDPSQMLSISSRIKSLDLLRAELCAIPKKNNPSGRFQVMTKAEMKKVYDIDSPNGADAVMMSLSTAGVRRRADIPVSAFSDFTPADAGAGY